MRKIRNVLNTAWIRACHVMRDEQGISVIELLSTSIGNEISEVLNSVFDYDFFEF